MAGAGETLRGRRPGAGTGPAWRVLPMRCGAIARSASVDACNGRRAWEVDAGRIVNQPARGRTRRRTYFWAAGSTEMARTSVYTAST